MPTFSNQLRCNFEKSWKRLLWPTKWSKWPSQSSEGQYFINYFDSWHLSTLLARNRLKRVPFQATLLPKQFQTLYEKAQKTGFFALKMVKITLYEGRSLNKNLVFRSHLLIFWAETTVKSESLKVKNNSWTISEQLSKVQKRAFWP